MRHRSPAPHDLAASMKSCYFSTRTVPRMMRAIVGVNQIVSTTMMLISPDPRTLTIRMAMSTPGNESMTSTRHMVKLSTHPPKKPAISPIKTPTSSPPSESATPFNKEEHAPHTVRAKTSRPSSSGPNQC